ncbi:sugar transferase [Micromonospora sp. WMMD1102]|uniref:sugar transferase n=1 Tax=Micromonospora sp. WMMD1102 TaxID=3016105 RepID=UPI002414D028|nr:sugar transferase [Micromonospora sp. WMMD1102]MDG4786745.1 sugar transferase [Micromonospora sp. WMMD1102]
MSSWPLASHDPVVGLPDTGPPERSPAAPGMPVAGAVDPAIDAPPVPRPRTGPPGPAERLRVGTDTTAVLPYAGSRASVRTRRLRAWMVTAPVDLVALLGPLLVTDRYWRGTVFTAGLTVAIFAAGGLYRARRHMSILDELPSLCGRLLASAAIVAIIAAMRHGSVEYMTGFMRGVVLSAGLVIVGRAITRRAVTVARKRRWVEHNAIIIGSGPVAAELARLLRRYPQYGLRFAGCVDAEERSGPGSPPLIGTLDQLADRIRLVECDVLVVAEPDCPENSLMELLARPEFADCDIWSVPRLWGSRSPGGLPDHIGAIPMVQIRHTSLTGLRWLLKRASDIVFCVVALVVLSPMLVLCALATWLEGGRGIFFHQERIGRYGRPFDVIKFRTMKPADETESRTHWSIADDQRIGPVGRFMRRTSLDELPQLWNILRGDMTVVGPRPERPYFVQKFSAEHPDYAMRHRVPVGLTGLAQVSGLRGDTPISDRARFDNYYIENWSLWLDTKVLLRTVIEVFRGGGR